MYVLRTICCKFVHNNNMFSIIRGDSVQTETILCIPVFVHRHTIRCKLGPIPIFFPWTQTPFCCWKLRPNRHSLSVSSSILFNRLKIRHCSYFLEREGGGRGIGSLRQRKTERLRELERQREGKDPDLESRSRSKGWLTQILMFIVNCTLMSWDFDKCGRLRDRPYSSIINEPIIGNCRWKSHRFKFVIIIVAVCLSKDITI